MTGTEHAAKVAVCHIAHAIDALCTDVLKLRSKEVLIPCPWCRAAHPTACTATAQAQKVLTPDDVIVTMGSAGGEIGLFFCCL